MSILFILSKFKHTSNSPCFIVSFFLLYLSLFLCNLYFFWVSLLLYLLYASALGHRAETSRKVGMFLDLTPGVGISYSAHSIFTQPNTSCTLSSPIPEAKRQNKAMITRVSDTKGDPHLRFPCKHV